MPGQPPLPAAHRGPNPVPNEPGHRPPGAVRPGIDPGPHSELRELRDQPELGPPTTTGDPPGRRRVRVPHNPHDLGPRQEIVHPPQLRDPPGVDFRPTPLRPFPLGSAARPLTPVRTVRRLAPSRSAAPGSVARSFAPARPVRRSAPF
ncbi:hypothetical protein [Dactylosporangium sp. NPDC049140]|uniref:hypothetical protein n=1 Tax=Dactylosporangium sp. NPDC049140 TaxID=3155647 RepID=UPI00340D51A6